MAHLSDEQLRWRMEWEPDYAARDMAYDPAEITSMASELLAARAILSEIADREESEIWWVSDWSGGAYCKYCEGEHPHHHVNCVYLRAKRLREGNDGTH